MELDIIEPVLREILEEQKINNRAMLDASKRIADLEAKVSGFQKRLEAIRLDPPDPPRPDTRPLENMAENYFAQFCDIVDSLPKKQVRPIRIQLFPEIHTEHFYKIVFGRIAPWSFGLIICLYLISLAKDYVKSSRQLKEIEYNYEIYSRSWMEFQKKVNKTEQKNMEQTLQKVIHDKDKADR